MQTFFHTKRRWIGCAVLLLALALMAAWIKSRTAGDVVQVSTPRHYNMLFSARGRLYWWSMINEAGICRALWHDEITADELIAVLDQDRPNFQRQESLQFRERSFAYSHVTVSVTLISALLILAPGRKQKA